MRQHVPRQQWYLTKNYFLMWTLEGGVQLGPLSIAATNRPIMPTEGDYVDGEIGGMMIGRGNWSTPRKPAPVPLCPPQTPHALPDTNQGRHGGKPARAMARTYGTYQTTQYHFWEDENLEERICQFLTCKWQKKFYSEAIPLTNESSNSIL
jgi:hypothetical protein